MVSQILGLPHLSIYDPEGSGSTSLDPLGLTPIGEQLAVELIPGVRERQINPRYLTAIAVSHAICQEIPPDTVAADGVSEPWQIYEWYVVEGLVRNAGSESEARVPGSQKTRKALAQGLPLCASRYLKTPTIFGFHGVYRLLARTLRVEQSNHLADFGFELLEVWQKEQGLPGFHGSAEGVGRNMRQRLTEAVKAGLKAGATDCSGGWFGWKFFYDHLEPTKAGPKEAELIWRQLKSGATGFAGEAFDFLVSQEGRALYRNKDSTEKELYAALKKVASKELRDRISTIERYELFCRLLHDAFEACRSEITQARRGKPAGELALLKPVLRAVERLPGAFKAAEESLSDPNRRTRFHLVFQAIAQPQTATEFVMTLYEHHKRIQKGKPPDGKAPWLEQYYDGSLLIRPDYQLHKQPKMNTEFLNPYRLNSLWSFAADLGRV